jgi:hypothetical protein
LRNNGTTSPTEHAALTESGLVAHANNLLVGRAAYETAVRLYPKDVIQYRDGARIIERSEPKAS